MFPGFVFPFWILRRVFYELQLTKEPSAVEARVGEESCNLSKDFPLLEGRSLVTSLPSDVFQLDRELRGEWSERDHHAQNGKRTCNVAFVLLSRNKCRRVTEPTSTSTYSARLI